MDEVLLQPWRRALALRLSGQPGPHGPPLSPLCTFVAPVTAREPVPGPRSSGGPASPCSLTPPAPAPSVAPDAHPGAGLWPSGQSCSAGLMEGGNPRRDPEEDRRMAVAPCQYACVKPILFHPHPSFSLQGRKGGEHCAHFSHNETGAGGCPAAGPSAGEGGHEPPNPES